MLIYRRRVIILYAIRFRAFIDGVIDMRGRWRLLMRRLLYRYAMLDVLFDESL